MQGVPGTTPRSVAEDDTTRNSWGDIRLRYDPPSILHLLHIQRLEGKVAMPGVQSVAAGSFGDPDVVDDNRDQGNLAVHSGSRPKG